MLEIKEITTPAQLEKTASLIRAAFAGVAKEMGLTQQNAPSHPAYTPLERLEAMQRKMPFFGLYLDGAQIGSVAIEKADDTVYYLERLAVLPLHRHQGYGAKLVVFVLDYVRKRGGTRVSLGMINSHTVLKEWYKSLGFVEMGTKQFEGLPFIVCFMDRAVST